MNSILFSIMVPVYQVEKYIERCINSVLNQTYENFELILVDDGTKDNSGIICDRFAKIDDRIKVFHKENEGLLATRRYALTKVKGDYYIFLDSDDTIESCALQVLHDIIKRTDADCVIYGLNRIENDKIVYSLYDNIETIITDKRELFLKCFTHNYNAIWRKAIRSNVIDGRKYNKFYNISYLEDLIQSIEIIENSKKVAFIPDVLYNYYGVPGSITQEKQKLYDNYDINNTVRYEVYQLFDKEKSITIDDINIFRKYCIALLLEDIDLIAYCGNSFNEKKEKIEAIRNSKYFREFIYCKDYNLLDIGKRKKEYIQLIEGKINLLLYKKRIKQLCSSLKKGILNGFKSRS